MKDRPNLLRRFEELAEQLTALAATKRYHEGAMISGDYVDNDAFVNWKLKARNLISLSCGESSLHFRDFVERETGSGYSTNFSTMQTCNAIFQAAREDYQGGYCTSIKTLIQSEVFDSELEQAEVFDSEMEQARALFDGGYLVAAAVVAGVVLETTLRHLYDNHKIAHAKLDKMNSDLAKVSQYTVLKQQQITAWADIRNNAAHGNTDKFTLGDVDDMISKVGAFVSDYL